MPTIFKSTLIFAFKPEAVAGVLTPPRSGGWSESFWHPALQSFTQMRAFGTSRAACMSPDCAVTGYRCTPYSYTLNKLLPQPATVGSFFVAGKFIGTTNSPDDTLRLRAVAGVPVSWTVFLHAIPDNVIESASYIQDNNFQRAYNLFVGVLLGAGQSPPIQWLGRDPTQQSQAVVSVDGANAKLTTAAALVGVAAGQYIRLRRVVDDNGRPIKGSFFVVGLVVNANLTVTYTVQGLPIVVRSTPSGTARRDVILSAAASGITPQLLASRKIGRPSLLFRGRRAKTRL